MVDVRGFRCGDGFPLVGLWNRGLPADPITYERFRDGVLLDPNFDPDGLRMGWDGDHLVGACCVMRRRVPLDGSDLEPSTGWCTFFVVAPEAQRRGIGRAVVTDAMNWLAAKGAQKVIFAGYTPNYVVPGLDSDRYGPAAALLKSLGFTVSYTAAAMDRSLVDYSVPDDVAKLRNAREQAGYWFGHPSGDDLVALIALARDHFNPDWGRAIREAVVAGLPLSRIVLARDPSGAIVGWAMHGTYERVIERFGPFGVLETQRGTGLGKVLLHTTLEKMKGAGAHSAWFLWTSEDSPAGQLYRKTGFTTTRYFDVMQAPLRKESS